MTAISLAIAIFVAIGLFARSFNAKGRLLVFTAAAGVVIFITLKP
jgi:hypothetical protein